MPNVLSIDCGYYLYPEPCGELDSFVQSITDRSNQFIPLIQFTVDNCVPPYFIKEEKQQVYLNISTMVSISQEHITILPREEYQARLREVVESLCITCSNYNLDNKDDLKSFQDTLCLDGTCICYDSII